MPDPKADQCLAYVGDFLQNADHRHRRRHNSRGGAAPTLATHDIFALLGIRDRATAATHPRCIALRTQFRYPKIIADIVNYFCYDGLLDSVKTTPPTSPVVTFVDTSGHPKRGLRRVEPSWTHPLGLELMTALYRNDTSGNR